MLLLPSPHRSVDADLRRVDVNHSPRHGSLEHLPKRLGRLEAVARGQLDSPRADFLRGQLPDLAITEDCSCLAEEVAELLDRHGLHIVLREVRLYELRKCERAGDPPLPPKPLKLALKGVTRILFGSESAPLNTLGVAPAGPIAIRP